MTRAYAMSTGKLKKSVFVVNFSPTLRLFKRQRMYTVSKRDAHARTHVLARDSRSHGGETHDGLVKAAAAATAVTATHARRATNVGQDRGSIYSSISSRRNIAADRAGCHSKAEFPELRAAYSFAFYIPRFPWYHRLIRKIKSISNIDGRVSEQKSLHGQITISRLAEVVETWNKLR